MDLKKRFNSINLFYVFMLCMLCIFIQFFQIVSIGNEVSRQEQVIDAMLDRFSEQSRLNLTIQRKLKWENKGKSFAQSVTNLKKQEQTLDKKT